jgi:hypothetical protein
MLAAYCEDRESDEKEDMLSSKGFKGVGVCLSATALIITGACARDARSLKAADTTVERVPSRLVAQSWPVCGLVGPQSGKAGVFGTDLGYTAREPSTGPGERLSILFGDTWADQNADCRYPRLDADDLTAFLPATRPPSLTAGPPTKPSPSGCGLLDFPRKDEHDASTWTPIHLYENADAAKNGDKPLETGMLKTPVSAFSDGQKVYAVYGRNEPAFCATSSDCGGGLVCTTDPSYKERRLGICGRGGAPRPDAAPEWCRDVMDCNNGLECQMATKGVCLATTPLHVATSTGPQSPTWYKNDPRMGMAHFVYIAMRSGADRPSEYVVQHKFVSQRFVNTATRTVTHFDAQDPSKDDYAPGTETLFVWGRPSFFGGAGAQSLPYFFYLPLKELAGGTFHPRFFAGYDGAGNVRWSDAENDAEPVYGTEATVDAGGRFTFAEPEFDYVNQMSVAYVAPLKRWIMVYGGDIPAFLVKDPRTRRVVDPTYKQRSPGALHFRSAPHPFGRLSNREAMDRSWTSAEPLLTRQDAAPYMACGDGGKSVMTGCIEEPDAQHPRSEAKSPDGVALAPGAKEKEPADRAKSAAPKCFLGELAYAAQESMSGDPIGRLYGANVIEEWTDDVTAKVGGLASGERAVEIYFNASTWNPYQVVLFKAQLRGTPLP